MGADRAKRKARGGAVDIAWEDGVRAKLRGSAVVNRLISYVNGEITLEPGQVTAALGLLRKCLPDLTASENKTTVEHRYVMRVPAQVETYEEWQKQYAPHQITNH
jgi:hypothetical protein